MSAIRRSSLVVLLAVVLSSGLYSQEVVTASGPADVPRFIAGAGTAQMRVQIISRDQAISFDSAWIDGNLLDWPPASIMATLPNGAYDCAVLARDLDGNVTQRRGALDVQDHRAVFQVNTGSDRIAVITPDEGGPKVTATVHDGREGAVISTAGDLSFRFGNLWLSKDREAMRLTAEGRLGIGTEKPEAPLDVNGLIRTTRGILFADGTILSSAAGINPEVDVHDGPRDPSQPPPILRQIIGDPLGKSRAAAGNAGLSPRANATPDYQFKVDATGVHIGTTSAFGLDVAGNVTLASNLSLPAASASGGVIKLGGNRFVHNFGTNNTFVGTNAGNLTLTTADAVDNTAIGFNALTSLTHGNGNTAVGSYALANNQGGAVFGPGSGWYNTALGEYALGLNTGGYRNTALGAATLYNNSSGYFNVAIGNGSQQYNTSGSYNVAVGVDSMQNNTTGSHNIIIGSQAAESGQPAFSLGSYNVYILDGTTGSIPPAESNVIRIGNSTANLKTFIAGIRGKTTGSQDAVPVLIDSYGQLGTASSSRRFKFDISDMDTATDGLMRLRPVTFRYLAHGADARLQYGLIAEEVAEVYPDLVTRNEDGSAETVMYQFLAPMLLNEVQKQQRTIEDLKKTIESLQGEVADLASRVRSMQKQ